MNLRKREIVLGPFDRFLEFISSVMLITLLGLPLFYYYKLPINTSISSSGSDLNRYFVDPLNIITIPMVGLVSYLALHAYNSYPKFYKEASGLFDLKGQNILIGKTRKLRFLKFLLTSLFTSISYYIAEINL